MAARKLNKKDGVDDLVLMDTVSEESIVENLHKRFKKSEIYTYIGPVLLSVNPFQTIRNLYGPTKIQQNCGRYAYELKPNFTKFKFSKDIEGEKPVFFKCGDF